MNFKRLALEISSNQFNENFDIKKIIDKELKNSFIKKEYHQDFKIIQITNKIKKQKTVESFLRAYYRIYNKNINVDGRGSSIIIEITKKCPKKCIHCYSKFSNTKKEMSDETLFKIIDYSKKNFKHIYITGGEPTLDSRIFTISKKYPDIIFFVFTNGSTITESYAKKLSKYGNLIPMISIDGKNAKEHNYLRGNGSYKEVKNAISNFKKFNIPWGFISLVTEKNIKSVFDENHIKKMVNKGAFIARFLEYMPVGPNPISDLILSGESYFQMEKRKKEIMTSGIIYMQETIQTRCKGLLFFTVNGDVKNCFCFHYSKYNILNGDICNIINNVKKEWDSYNWKGECPLYSDPYGFKNFMEGIGWKNLSTTEEKYLTDPKIYNKMKDNYKNFLKHNKKTKIQSNTNN